MKSFHIASVAKGTTFPLPMMFMWILIFNGFWEREEEVENA